MAHSTEYIIKKGSEYYDSLEYEERMKLRAEFGNEGVVGYELKLYKWIVKNKLHER